MHKKIQSLILTGIITVNTISPTLTVFANDLCAQEEVKIETSTDETAEDTLDTPSTEEVQEDISVDEAITEDVIEEVPDTSLTEGVDTEASTEEAIQDTLDTPSTNESTNEEQGETQEEVEIVDNTVNTPDVAANIDQQSPEYQYAPQENEWKQFKTVNDLSGYWDHSIEVVNGANVVVLGNYTGAAQNPKVEIPRTLDGMPVELANLNTAAFTGVTHIRVANGDKSNEVKLRSTTLDSSFRGNNVIEYINLNGLNTSGLTRVDHTFAETPNLKYLNLSYWDVQNVTHVSSLVFNCSNLEHLDLSGWKLKKTYALSVTLFGRGANNIKNYIFRDSDSFTYNQIKNANIPMENITFIDVTNMKVVDDQTNLAGMFKVLKSAKEIVGLDTWTGVEKITGMNNMFMQCNSLTTISGMKKWNLANVTSTAGMFKECTSLEKLDLNIIDMEKVTSTYQMFQGCTNLREIKGTEKWTLKNNRNIDEMFKGCDNLNLIDFSSLSLPSNVSTYQSFRTDSQKYLLILTNDNILKNYRFGDDRRVGSKLTFDTQGGTFPSGVSNQTETVYTVDSIKDEDIITVVQAAIDKRVPVKPGWDFAGWTVKNQNFSTDRIKRVFEMMNNTYTANWESEWQKNDTETSLQGVWIFRKEPDAQGQNKIILMQYIGSNPKVEIPKVIDGMPTELENLSRYVFPNVTHVRIADSKGGNKLKLLSDNLQGDFGFNSNDTIEHLNLEGLDTTSLTNLNGAFKNCSKLKYLNLSNWNVSNVTDMSSMFKGCSALTDLNMYKWDTSKVENMSYMFEDLTMNEIKRIESFNTSNVTDMTGMFKGCKNTTYFDLRKWVLQSNVAINDMFDVSYNNGPSNLKDLLVLVKSNVFENYNFEADCRRGQQLTFNATGGQFQDGKSIKTSNICVIDASKGFDLVESVEAMLPEEAYKMEEPTRAGFAFDKWELAIKPYSTEDDIIKALEILNSEYQAIWIESMINVTVPIDVIDFKLDTNPTDPNADPFKAGIVKIENNSKTRPVKVSVKDFTEEIVDLSDGSHKVNLLDPEETDANGNIKYDKTYWDNLTGNDSITNMSIGVYPKSGVTGNSLFTEDNPLWLKPNKTKDIELGTIPQSQEAEITFAAKHAKVGNFGSIKSKGKFKLMLVFE